MDADRFDKLARSLIVSPSRRSVLGLTLAGGVGSLLGLTAAEAKKKKRKKKKCKGNKKKCGKKCIPKTNCCTDANCGGGATCQGGACLCPAGQQDCEGTCIPDSSCCTDADCGPLKLCADGVCVVGQGSCPDAITSCVFPATSCGPLNLGCVCFQNTAGDVRCGDVDILVLGEENPCGACVNDADCEELHPDVPGVFCTKSGIDCGCFGFTFCQAPCPG